MGSHVLGSRDLGRDTTVAATGMKMVIGHGERMEKKGGGKNGPRSRRKYRRGGGLEAKGRESE